MNIPHEANLVLSAIRKRLPDSLFALYLHGSAVAGGLRPHSDVDLLAIVDKTIDYESRKRLAADLMETSGRYPFDSKGRRPIELIIFLRADILEALYPVRCDFIYGEWLRRAYETEDIPNSVYDPELTLILAQARQNAKTLVGPSISEVLPAIPQSDIRRAIGDALPALVETFPGDERNVLLTLARMWRTLSTGEFVSKDAAADWAAARLPEEHATVLFTVREAYLGLREDEWNHRQQEIRRTMHALHERVIKNLF